MTIFNVAIGLLYCFVSLILIFLNATILLVMVREKEYKTRTYRIIKHSCLACIMQLCAFFAGGLMTMAGTIFHYYFDRIFGALVLSGWFLYLALSLTLAVDRFLLFVSSKSSKINNTARTVFLSASWILSFCVCGILFIPGYGYSYEDNVGLYFWDYTNERESHLMQDVEVYVELIVLSLIFVVYILVFAHIIKLKKQTAVQSTSFKLEIRIVIIAVISFTYESLFIAINFWMPDELSKQIPMLIVINLSWIIDCGMLAFVLLLVNSKLRRKTRKLFVKKRNLIFVSSAVF